MQKLTIHDAPSICFVSSHCWDTQGAAQFGFQSVRLNREDLPDEYIPGKPAARIASLEDLAALV
jgi:2-haloacid dehalogenase